jgi:electron transfer flavoprotein beta subunit
VIVAVLLAGIADPKWPLDGAHARIASPFDESALEVALKLRDAGPDTHLAFLVAASAQDEPFVRAVASHRPDSLLRVEVPAALAWDLRAQAALWKSVLETLPEAPAAILLGREFGDRDDGAFAPCLAEALGRPFAGLAQEVRKDAKGWEAMRERGTTEERITLAGPFVASITNDPRNRLRHPLMKNVMAAKRLPIAAATPNAPAAPQVTLAALAPAAPAQRAVRCRMIEGSPTERVAALAAFLAPWRAQA